MALTLEVRTADGGVRRQALRGGSNTISVDPGATYRVLDDATGRVSANATIRRVDNDLVIGNLEPRPGDAPVTVTFDEYYNVCSAVSPCDVSLPVEGSTAPVVVNVTTTPIGALADGSFVIRDPAYSGQATVAEDDGLSTRTCSTAWAARRSSAWRSAVAAGDRTRVRRRSRPGPRCDSPVRPVRTTASRC